MKIQEFDFSADILRSLLWRHNEAPNLTGLLQDKQDNFDIDHRDFWDDWITDVFDLRTANEFGLNLWSIILGVNIAISPEVEAPNSSWGFGPDRKNFDHGNFSSSAGDLVLGLEDARIVLKLRYYQLTTNCNVFDLNLMLADVFGDLGTAYVRQGTTMELEYWFLFDVPSILLLVLDNFDILPRPAAVTLELIIIP